MSVAMKSSVVSRAGLKASTVKAAPVAVPRADRMMVWQPVNNK